MSTSRNVQIDHEVRGRRAECLGATPDMLTGEGPPEEHQFVGTLTGEFYREERFPARMWYRMVGLTTKPPLYKPDEVWCDRGEVWLLNEPG